MLVLWAPYHVQDATKIYLVSLPEVKCEYEDDPKCPDHHDHCGVSPPRPRLYPGVPLLK